MIVAKLRPPARRGVLKKNYSNLALRQAEAIGKLLLIVVDTLPGIVCSILCDGNPNQNSFVVGQEGQGAAATALDIVRRDERRRLPPGRGLWTLP